ncbi:serine/threonine-protein kinase [Archangium primigenium]|uniref:serine/threonine-protein kinase n=1 Tax=[Archangium] primigenium TaxID=2792470 RepID=UPI00195F0417|nr:serine/threonine-protein kinase [Archangium primigenium]MBM7119367.1 protein kinase [Archangium primigenium]
MESTTSQSCACSTPHESWGTCPTLVHAASTLPPATARENEFVGQRFGSFRVLRELGRGGMGTVLLAEHVLIPKRVAVKVLHRHLAQTPELLSRLVAEARAMCLVQHENVATLYDLELRDGLPYFVMEYLEGQSLADFARGPLPPALVVELLGQVCDALGAAHARGIVHRDLKPANVFLVPGAHGRQRVKLLDFGIAKRLVPQAGDTPTRTGVIMGTPEFMAPEQCAGGEVDARTDLYAVGVLGHLLLTGRAPFRGESAAAVLVAHLQQAPRPAHEAQPGVPPALSAVLLRALAKRPEERFASAAELRAALEAALTRAPPRPTPITFSACLVSPKGSVSREYLCEPMGRAGLFLRTLDTPPALLSDVPLRLALPGGELACVGQVVRHVTPAQARAWNMSPGFGVELRDNSPAFQKTFARLLEGQPAAEPPPAPAEDARVAAVVAEFRQRLTGDRYCVLGVPRDADLERIRRRAREAREQLEPLLALPLPPAQRAFLQRALGRVTESLGILGHPERRVEYDAELGNLRGVMRCLASGLTVTAMEAARQRYFARHPQTEGHAVLHMASAESFVSASRFPEALACYEAALRADPLHLEALKRWHALRARMRGDAVGVSPR